MTRRADGDLLLFETTQVECVLPGEPPSARPVCVLAIYRGIASYVLGRAITNLP